MSFLGKTNLLKLNFSRNKAFLTSFCDSYRCQTGAFHILSNGNHGSVLQKPIPTWSRNFSSELEKQPRNYSRRQLPTLMDFNELVIKFWIHIPLKFIYRFCIISGLAVSAVEHQKLDSNTHHNSTVFR
jgi:hypothetical protein